jgi:hypothetical protein
MSDDDTITVITKSGAYFEERGQAGSYVRVEDVAELVKAAAAVLDDKGSGWLDANTVEGLKTAIKPFER